MWLVFYCLLPAAAMPAVPPDQVPLNHQSWSTEDGLPEASVHQILQSSDGYLWLATEGGVARFDGAGFRVFRHENEPAFASNDISAIAEDTSGALWFGTADGLIQMQNGTFRRFAGNDGLPSPTVLALAAARDGSLLVLTARGLVRFYKERFLTSPLPSGPVAGLQAHPDGSVWVLTAKGVFVYPQIQGFRGGGSEPNRFRSAQHDPVLGVQLGPGSAVWSYTARTLTERTPAFERTFEATRDLPCSRISALLVDREGTAWIGTNRGLFSLAPSPHADVQSREALGLDSVLSLLQDREGNLWIGTETSGLHALRPRKFRSETSALGDAVTAGLTQPDGTVWFGTRDDGLRRLQHGTTTQPVPASALTSPVVLSMTRDGAGHLWVGTPDGLNEIQGHAVHRYTSADGLPDDFVRSLAVGPGDVVWAGTRNGLARIGEGKITSLTQQDGLGSNSIGPLLVPATAQRGTNEKNSPELWVGTASGLSHIVGSRIQNFLPSPGRNHSIITALAQATDGTLWVGTQGSGLSRFVQGHFQPVQSARLPLDISALFADGQGYLWLRASRGMYHVKESALQMCAGQASRCDLAVADYGVADGMPSDASPAQGSPSIWASPNGELWFATRKGLAVADPARLPLNLTPPPVVVERLLVDETPMLLTQSPVKISAGHSRYTFDYAALSYTLPSKNRYRYMLEGFDRNWVEAGAVRSVSYTSLPARRYRFRVEAANNDGVWNEKGAELRFQILPPFYRSWWFYALVLLFAIVLVVSVLQLRVRAVQRSFALVLQERNRMAREIHDTLAQDFVSVSLQLDLAAQLLRAKDVDRASTQVETTRKLVKEGLEAARQSIWNLRAHGGESSLPVRLQSLVKRYADATPSPQLKMGGAFRQLAPATEDNVLRIAQESLANVYRHAAATEVFVQLQYETAALKMTVRDNGRGFAPETASRLEGHYGLKGMHERAASLGARLTIASSQEGGTAVTLVVPLAAKEERSA